MYEQIKDLFKMLEGSEVTFLQLSELLKPILNNKTELYKAVGAFQSECPVMVKTVEAKNYKYVDLGFIIDTIQPILTKNNLSINQIINNDTLKTILSHNLSGQTLESSIDINKALKMPFMNDLQSFGCQLTYLRRYAISSILNIVTETDTDGKANKNNTNNINKPVNTENTNNTQITWLTFDQFNKALNSNVKGIKATLQLYSTETMKMKHNYKQELTKQLNTLLNNKGA